MRRLIHHLILALMAACTPLAALADPPAPPGATAPAGAATSSPAPGDRTVRPALWKVADEDTTIYLFGTIHALPAGVIWLSGPIEAALAASDQLVTEIPETDPGQMQAAVTSSALLPAGQSLRALLPAEDRTRFEAVLAGFSLPAEAFDRFEPWYAAIALTTLPLAQKGFSAQNGVEETIAAAARKLGKPRTGLETAAHQLAMFDGLPREVQIGYLRDVMSSLPTIDEELARIVEQWSSGDAERLASLLNADDDDPRMVAALLTDRNRAWAEWISARMKQPGTVFMAVGAGHLSGKDSVQDILGKAGIAAGRVQ